MEGPSPDTAEDMSVKSLLQKLQGKMFARPAVASSPSRSSTDYSQDLAFGEESDRRASLASSTSIEARTSANPLAPPQAKPSAGGDQSLGAQTQPQASISPDPSPQADRASELWATAYDEVEVALPELVSRYEEILSRYLTQEVGSAESEGDNEDADAHHTAGPSLRERMDEVLEAWFAQQLKPTSVENSWKKIVSVVRDTWEKTSQASLPWVALCLSVQVRDIPMP